MDDLATFDPTPLSPLTISLTCAIAVSPFVPTTRAGAKLARLRATTPRSPNSSLVTLATGAAERWTSVAPAQSPRLLPEQPHRQTRSYGRRCRRGLGSPRFGVVLSESGDVGSGAVFRLVDDGPP